MNTPKHHPLAPEPLRARLRARLPAHRALTGRARWHAVMAALPLSLMLAASVGAAPARAASRCDTGLERIEEGRRVVRGLQRSRASLTRQRRARLRGQTGPGKTLEQIDWMLGPIDAQLEALRRDLPKQERAYLRCVEAELETQRTLSPRPGPPPREHQ